MGKIYYKLKAMTLLEAVLRICVALTPLHPYFNWLLRKALNKPGCRAYLNQCYLNFTQLETAFFHALFCRAFYEQPLTIGDFEWTVNFLGKHLKMPICSETMWLDWNLATAITGHDIEVKITYETLLSINPKPRVFYDVGANYGTHSMLFSAHGLDVAAFEPNPACHSVHRRIFEINRLVPHILDAAVSDMPGKSEFWFPERETWLGTMDGKTKHTLASGGFELQKIKVAVTTLDDYVRQGGTPPDVIKIDTEGNELKVLQGALLTIDIAGPFIIFESNTGGRAELWQFMYDHNYIIAALPVRDLDHASSLSIEDFVRSLEGNFIAIPKARL